MTADRASAIGGHLQDMRRYAWAYMGARDAGDDYVAAMLDALISKTEMLDPALPLNLGLYRILHNMAPDNGHEAHARAAHLFHAILDLTHTDIGTIMELNDIQVAQLIRRARQTLADASVGNICVATDDPQTRQTLGAIILSLGHNLVADGESADLILADVANEAQPHVLVVARPYTVEQIGSLILEALFNRAVIS